MSVASTIGCTVGEIANDTGVSRDRILYIIRSRAIQPAHRAGGHYRLFSAAQVEQIKQVLADIAARRATTD